MRKNYLAVAVCLLFFSSIKAQQSNIDSIIQAQPENVVTYRIKARNYFLQELQAGNQNQVKKLRNYFTEKYRKKMPLLNHLEWSFTLLYLQEYDSIINSALVAPKHYAKQRAYSVFHQQFFALPDTDTDAIVDFYKQNAAELQLKIETSHRTEAEKEFLEIYLQALLTFYYYNRTVFFDYALIEQANNFLKHHPSSPLTGFLKRTFRYKWNKGDWNFETGLLAGTMNVTADYHKYFNYIAGGGFNLALNYKKIYCLLQFHNYYGTVAKTFQTTEIWQKDTAISAFISQLAFGYSIIDNKTWELTPYIGISWLKQSVLDRNYYSNTIVNDIFIDSNQLFGCRLRRNIYRLPLLSLNRSKSEINLNTAFVFADGGFMLLNKTDNILPRGDMYYFTLGFGISLNNRKLTSY